MALESKHILELHIFKDPNGTNWTNPHVYTFPLSSQSFRRFNRADQHPENRSDRHHRTYQINPAYPYMSRDGLLNLWKCGPQQLAFLQKHIDQQNVKVQENIEKLYKEYKKLKEEDQKFNEAEQRRHLEEMEKFNQKKKGNEEDEQGRKSCNSPRSIPCEPSSPPPPGLYPSSPEILYPNRVERRDRDEQPKQPKLRKTRVNPMVYETTWTLESVELDLEPFEAVFESDPDRGLWRPVKELNDEIAKPKGWEKGSFKISRYRLSEQGKCEFAIVISRNIAVRSPEGGGGNRARYYRGRARSTSSCDSREWGPLSAEGSVCGERYFGEEEEKGGEAESKEKEIQAQEGTSDEEEDHDIEVVPSPNETSLLKLEDERRGE